MYGVRATIAVLSALTVSSVAQAQPRTVADALPSTTANMGISRDVVAAPQQTFVAGTVLEEGSLRPLAGAQVIIDGTQQGTLTDAAGRFTIGNVSGPQVTLRVIMLGYRTETQTVPTGQRDVRIILEETAVELDRIVVTGTPGQMQKRALGNSLAEIDAGGLTERQPIVDVGQMLNARAAGVSVGEQMGIAGGGARILIRGPGSLSFNGNPLIYVDGIRINSTPNTGPAYGQAGGAGAPSAVSRLNDINPADIERIEIIKGPAAATLYGTEASAGVIQIITKKGTRGQMRMQATVRQGANWFYDAENRMPLTWGFNPTSGQVESLNLTKKYADMGEPLFRTGHLQTYGVNLSGGTDQLRYYSGIEMDMNEGVIPTNDDRSFNGRLNLSVTPMPTVNADMGFAFDVGRTSFFHALYFGSIVYSTPGLLDTPNKGFLVAPAYAYADMYDYDQDVNRYQANFTVNHRPMPWLSHRLTGGLDFTNQRFEILRPVTPPEYTVFFGPSFNRGGKSVERTTTTYATLDYAATADWKPTPDLGSSTSFGAQYYRTFQRFENVSGNEFPAAGVQTVSGASLISGSENFLEQVTVGLYVQQQLSWQDRIFLTAAVRADDHSAFGAEFDLVTYPKFSASWVLSEESFWNFDFINTLKVRAAYGESGQQPATFAAIRTYTPITGEGDLPAGSPQAPGNPDLGPERGQEVEVGFDAALFNDLIGLEFTYYNQHTTDVIIEQSVAPSGGFSGTQFINAGEIANTGFEALLRATPYRGDNVLWDVTLNLSRNHNEVISLGVDADFLPVGWIPNRHQVGFPVDSYFRKKIVSADLDASGNAINLMCDGGTGKQGVEPGGAPVDCATAPYLYVGKPFHDWNGSFSTSVTLFDRLQLSGLLDFKYGGQLFESIKYWNCAALINHEIDYFPERYPATEVAECTYGLDYLGTTRIQDNGFTKLRELSLSYQLPETWAARVGAQGASITVAGRNLFTWTSFDGLDPETFTPVNYLAGAHTELTVPLPRSFMTTVNLTF